MDQLTNNENDKNNTDKKNDTDNNLQEPDELCFGFWYSEVEPHWPMPKATLEPNSSLFLEKLKQITDTINASVTSLVEQSKEIELGVFNEEIIYGIRYEYSGNSYCRVCRKENGDLEYCLRFCVSSKEIIFPSGLYHYYADHNVKPEPDFYDFIMSFKLNQVIASLIFNETSYNLESIKNTELTVNSDDILKNFLTITNGFAGMTFMN